MYDFALPLLVLHTLFARNARALGEWLSMRPQNCVTVFAILLLPSLGLFMSVLYPTLNSEGIGFFANPSAVSGVILFFTCVAAVLGPLAMGVISDYFANPKYGFVLATIFAAVLFVGLLLNRIFDPARDRLQHCDRSEYDLAETKTVGTQPRT